MSFQLYVASITYPLIHKLSVEVLFQTYTPAFTHDTLAILIGHFWRGYGMFIGPLA
jgi:hypothetical protein